MKPLRVSAVRLVQRTRLRRFVQSRRRLRQITEEGSTGHLGGYRGVIWECARTYGRFVW